MSDRRRIAVLTTGRQDYGILRSTVLALRADSRFELLLWAGGMHLSQAHGRTLDLIANDGLPVDEQFDILAGATLPSPAEQSARMLACVAEALGRHRPDALLLLGDRHETLAAAFAAALQATPIVHLHGGEETEGAVDNALRHALTKLAHLHLVSHPLHARRVRQMGEPADAVVVVGAAGLDNLHRNDLPTRTDLERDLGIPLLSPVVVVTLHPTTLAVDAELEVQALTSALQQTNATYVITQPNVDGGGEAIRAHLVRWGAGRSRVALVDALGEKRYWGLLRVADAMVGNSSSGLIEAPAAGLPVVNVGDRQLGRLRSEHVRDVPADSAAIAEALAWATDPATLAALAEAEALYPRGPAAPRIVEALVRWAIPQPPRKRFVDGPGGDA